MCNNKPLELLYYILMLKVTSNIIVSAHLRPYIVCIYFSVILKILANLKAIENHKGLPGDMA